MSVPITRETVDISGFGGGYEDQCQRMLWRGIAYLAEVQPPLTIWDRTHSYAGIYGVLHTEGEGIKALEAAMIHPDDDVTGAMHQATMSLVAYIHKYGVEQWLAEVKARQPERIRTWTGSLE